MVILIVLLKNEEREGRSLQNGLSQMVVVQMTRKVKEVLTSAKADVQSFQYDFHCCTFINGEERNRLRFRVLIFRNERICDTSNYFYYSLIDIPMPRPPINKLLRSIFLLSLSPLFIFQACGQAADHQPPAQDSEVTLKVDTIATGLEVPWAIAFLPNGDMIFTEREGNIRIIRDGELLEEMVSGVPEVKSKGQGGLFDLKLHPDYENSGWIYFTFSSPMSEEEGAEEGKGANTELRRAKLEGMTLVDQETLFKASPNYSKNHHYGARIAFDEAGYLYLSVGDRGGRDEVQSLSNYRGKILRFYDDGRIPEDNPFVNQAGAKPEIYSYGHRNPQGLTERGGQIWEHEHGPKGGDEINLIQAGHNYGWPEITYGINYTGTIITEDTAKAGMDQPINYWVPSIAPCGMDFIDSEKYGDWDGDLLVGSLKFRYLVRCEMERDEVTGQEILLRDIGRVRAITQGPDGYVYVGVEGPGMILRLRL